MQDEPDVGRKWPPCECGVLPIFSPHKKVSIVKDNLLFVKLCRVSKFAQVETCVENWHNFPFDYSIHALV